MGRIAALTSIAMLAFAANSVLARLALGGGGMDAFAYTGIRLGSGALMLALLVALRGRPLSWADGKWRSAAALFGYALCFSIAYLMLSAGTGALILFASVQLGMLGWAISRGDRPGPLEALGMVLAFGGLLYLLAPGLTAPNPFGAALMVVVGALLGRLYAARARLAQPADRHGGQFPALPAAGPAAGCGQRLCRAALTDGDFLCRALGRGGLGARLCHLVCGAAGADPGAGGDYPAQRTGHCGAGGHAFDR